MMSENQGPKKRRSGLRLRFQLIIGGLVVVCTVLLAIIAVVSLRNSNRDANNRLRTALRARYRAEVQHQVETIASLIETHYRNGRKKGIEHNRLQEEVKAMVRKAHYDWHFDQASQMHNPQGYFFLYKKGGVCVAHGSNPPKYENKNLWNWKDPHGILLIRELEKAAQAGGGFVRYQWDKPGTSKALESKISYAKMLPSLNWWVGTGVYLDDVDKVTNSAIQKQQQHLRLILLRFGILAAVLLGAALILGLVLGAHVTRPITTLVEAVGRLASGRYETRVSVRSNDEIRDLGDAINTMAEQVSEAMSEIELSDRFNTKILESVADGLVVTNRDNEIVQVNPAAERIFNYAPEELLGKELNVLLPKEIQEDYKRSTLDEVNRGLTVVNYNVRRVRKTGESVYLTVAVAPIFDDDGQVILRIHSVTDMTEQHSLLERLEQAERLRKFLPAQTSEADGGGKISTPFERRRITLFYTHLKGLCELNSELEPEEFTSLVTEFLKAMNDIIYKYDGTLDKFLGDGQMGFFGAPETKGEKKDARSCVLMALEMGSELERLNQHWKLRTPLRLCVGINTGYVTLGNFGSEYHLDYTAVGISVLVAQRLSQHCQQSGVLVSHDTRRYLSDEFEVLSQDAITIAGLVRPVEVYSVEILS